MALLQQLLADLPNKTDLYKDRIRNLYSAAFQSVNTLRTELHNSTIARKDLVLEQFGHAYGSLTLSAVQDKALATCVNVTVGTTLWADERLNLVHWAGYLLSKAKALDDNRYQNSDHDEDP